MIVTESVNIHGHDLRRTYSSTGCKIQKVGTNEIYDEAVDVDEQWQYVETAERVEAALPTPEEMAEFLALFGVVADDDIKIIGGN